MTIHPFKTFTVDIPGKIENLIVSYYNIISKLLLIPHLLFQGTWLVMQAFAGAMTQASVAGAIVNISSIVGKYGNMGKVNIFENCLI